MNEVNIFNYLNPRDFLLEGVSAKRKKNSAYSIRALARDMGLKSHSAAAMLLAGSRPFTQDHVPSLVKAFKLNVNEQLYLQTIIQLVRSKTTMEKEQNFKLINTLNPQAVKKIFEIEQFNLVSKWIHSALLTLFKCFELKDETEILKKLKFKISLNEIRSAVSTLLELKLIEKLDSGVFRPTHNRTSTKNDVSSEAVQNHHREVLKLAEEGLLEDVGLREYQAFSVSVSTKSIKKAKELIREFREKFIHLIEEESEDSVYQMNIQFFPVTKIKKIGGKSENV